MSGSEEATEYMTSLLERAPVKAKETPPPKSPSHKLQLKETPSESEAGDQKERSSLFDRPLPLEKLSGKRHVPVLFNANHIPVLRLKKPQPESLSRFIRQRVKQRQARHNLRFQLYEELKIAAWEDEWDELIAEHTEPAEQGVSLEMAMLGARAKTKGVEESQWTDVVEDAIWEVHGKLNEEREKNRVMAEKMQAVVDRERELFEKERALRKEVKRAERLKRREERRQRAQQETEQEQKSGSSEPMAMAK